MPNSLTWLHISDIHFHPGKEWRDSVPRNYLLDLLRKEFKSQPSLRPDLILCTGDVAFGEMRGMPIEEQYQQAESFFDELLTICGAGDAVLPKERLFIVPGNHDVNRAEINNDAQQTLIRWANDSRKHLSAMNNRFERRTREFKDTMQRLKAYENFVNRYVPHQEDKDGRQVYAHVVELADLKIGIGGFNSSWTCAGDEDKNHLWMASEWQFNQVQESLKEADIRIGLIHHPLNWLTEADSEIAKRRIATEFDFWLHGHEHDQWVDEGNSHITISAGAVLAHASEEFGVNIVQLDLEQKNGSVNLYKRDARMPDWTIAPIPTHAPRGVWNIALPRRLQKSATVTPSAPSKTGAPVAVPVPESAAPQPKPNSSLPHQPFFFGREKELGKIADAISPDARTWGALIDGPGGIGKTSLAIRAGYIAPDTDFDHKIFLSAKVRDLKSSGEQPLEDFRLSDYMSLITELAKELGDKEIEKLVPNERPKAVNRRLKGVRALIIIDNLETFPSEERLRLYQFLSRLPATCKAIVTSRRRDDIDARVIRLDRLEKKDALSLLEELAKNIPPLKRATKKEKNDLYEITNGNPLLIRWTTGQLGRTGGNCRTIPQACKFLENAPAHNDPLEYIFGDLLDTFSNSETAVIAALAHFTLPAPIEWIASVAGINASVARTALEDLTDRALLLSDNDRSTFLLPPLAGVFLRRKKPEIVQETGGRLTDKIYALVLENGFEQFERFPMLQEEWDAIKAAIPIFIKGENSRLQELCDALHNFLDYYGYWDDAISLFTNAEEVAAAAEDFHNAGWRAENSGFLFALLGQGENVMACAERCQTHWNQASPQIPFYRSAYLRMTGLGHRMLEDYPKAKEAFQEAVSLVRMQSEENENIVTMLISLGGIKQLLGEHSEAEKDYKEALVVAKKLKDRDGIATITGNLAEVAIDQERWEEAEKLAREALKQSESLGRKELIGSHCTKLAVALARQGKPTEGLPYGRRALEIFSLLPHHNGLNEAEHALKACGG